MCFRFEAAPPVGPGYPDKLADVRAIAANPS
jgi:hypothetical protein